jgi:hypothetical protein
MPEPVLDVTSTFDRGTITEADVNTTLKVLRTLRNLALEPENFDAQAAVMLSHAHHCVMECYVASQKIHKQESELLQVAKELREWAAQQGGWEAPCWDQLTDVLESIRETADDPLWTPQGD